MVLSFFATAAVLARAGDPIHYAIGAQGGLFDLAIDPVSAFMLFLATVPGFVAVLFSLGYLTIGIGREAPEDPEVPSANGCYFAWLLAAIGAMVGIALAANYLLMLVFLILASVSAWGLVGYRRDEQSTKAATTSVTVLGIACALFALAVILLYSSATSDPFAFDALSRVSGSMAIAIFALFLAVAAITAAQFPLFGWLQRAVSAPTPITVYLHGAALVNAGLYVLLRVTIANPDLPYGLGVAGCVIALITIVLCVVLATYANDLKQALALITSAQLGVILAAIACGVLGSAESVNGALLQMVKIGVGLGLMFLSIGQVMRCTGKHKVSELSGLGRRLPFASTGFFIGAFTVTGMAPFPGFWGQTLIVTNVVDLGGFGILVGTLLVLEALAVFGYLLWLGHHVFFGAPIEECNTAIDAGEMRLSVVIMCALCLLVPFLSLPLLDYVSLGM
jgi:hydrogenase-4 component D